MNIEFTKEEAQVLVNLIDTAVKAKGLEAAEAAVVLTRKIAAAAQAAEATHEALQPNGHDEQAAA